LGEDYVNTAPLPISWISCEDAEDYCRWLTRQAKERGNGAVYRLPGHDEWAKAAGGVDGRCFPWGNRFDVSFVDSAAPGSVVGPSPVGSKAKDSSPYGALDMAGSISEWCGDRYMGDDGLCHIRGGTRFDGSQHAFRVASTSFSSLRTVASSLGFRVVKEAPKR
jgi:formylglycine-generating enzyme required for sulfatase activity